MGVVTKVKRKVAARKGAGLRAANAGEEEGCQEEVYRRAGSLAPHGASDPAAQPPIRILMSAVPKPAAASQTPTSASQQHRAFIYDRRHPRPEGGVAHGREGKVLLADT